MATPTLSKHTLPGVLGDILIDLRSGGRSSPRPAVVVLHGFKGFKDWGMFPPFSERLARAGFTAITPNLSGSGVDDHGEFAYPERFGHNTFSAELEDLRRVIDAVFQGGLGVPPPSVLGLMGHSRGGGVSILQTARDPRVKALVTWSAISTIERWPAEERAAWRKAGVTQVKNVRTGQVLPLYTGILDDIDARSDALDIQAAARRITVPWLLAHGTADESVPLREALALANASTRAQLLKVEGGGHTFGAVHPWKGMTPELDLLFNRSIETLSQSLL
ncbi:MAG TPA: alpha/beta fold hydrolase [Gemmatimonadales bacterium]|jgi:dienelactone hydrolase